MHAIRAFLHTRRRLALALVVLALAMKAVMPAGFMPAAPGKIFSVMICDGAGSMQMAKLALPGDGPGESKSTTSEGAKAQGTCPFAGLSAGALGGADGLLLAALIAFILTLGFIEVPLPPLRRAHYSSPPLRGPPAFA